MENILYNPKAGKKATNVSINGDLLKQAKALKINLSKTLEDRLAELLIDEKRRIWKEENRDAIDDYNRRINDKGAFSDGLRRF